ncbi:MAG TPA: NUDIX hydrolase [Candidatus Nanoarchaeia archaeon]
MLKKWELLKSETVFESDYVRLYRDTLEKGSGKIVEDFYSIERKNWIEVLALTDENTLPLVYQYRNGLKDTIWTLPAGYIDQGQTPEEAAKRELLEETGFTAENFSNLGSFAPSPGFTSELAFVFLARGARKIQKQQLDENEEIEVKLFKFGDLLESIKKKAKLLVDSTTVLSLLLAEKELNK